MTNEFAIKVLTELKGYGDKFANIGYDRKEALDLAIKALEQQPSEDCVNRDALINELKCGYWDKNLQSAKNDPCIVDAMIDWSIRTVKSQPSVTPQQTRWIPCSERLPEEYNHVLCQFCMGGMAECYYANNFFHVVGGLRINSDEVVAWMPLPTPYQPPKMMCEEDKE